MIPRDATSYRLPPDVAYWQDTVRHELRWLLNAPKPTPGMVQRFYGIPITDMTRAELLALVRHMADKLTPYQWVTPPARGSAAPPP